MDKEFVQYQQALELKELGFDEPCLSAFFDDRIKSCVGIRNSTSGYLSAPLFSQAFRWFREKYGYFPLIEFHEGYRNQKWMSRYANIDGSLAAIGLHDTYDEAEITTLNKLIEILKGRKGTIEDYYANGLKESEYDGD
jgi:hypothetical protein